MPTPTLTKTPAGHWRVMNTLFYADIRGALRIHLSWIIRQQDVSFDDLCDLNRKMLIGAWHGRQELWLPNINPNSPGMSGVELRLASRGRARVTRDPYNNVICTLGHERVRATVKVIRDAADVKDEVLIEMAGKGLLVAPASNLSLETFRRLPDDLLLKLTPAARAYLPR
jgi:hypothetical protein